jgi:hypothetical protein
VSIATIGTGVGRDYSTISEWAAADAEETGECYNDSIFDESVTIDGTVATRLTVAEGERHDGTAGTGSRIVRSADAFINVTTAVNAFVGWLEVNHNGKGGFSVLTNSVASKIDIVGMLLHSAIGANGFVRLDTAASNHDQGAANCIAYDLFRSGTAGTLGGMSHTGTVSIFRRKYFRNITLHNVRRDTGGLVQGLSSPDVDGSSVENCLVTDTSTGPDFLISTSENSIARNNASSDATAPGPNGFINVDPSEIYISTVPGFEDLRLRRTSDLYDAGADLSETYIDGIEISIEGRDRSTRGQRQWSIGASEPEPAVGAFTGIGRTRRLGT